MRVISMRVLAGRAMLGLEQYLRAHPVEADADAVWERQLPEPAYLYVDEGEGEGRASPLLLCRRARRR